MKQIVPVQIEVATQTHAHCLAELGAATFRETFAADNTPEDMSDYLQQAFTPARLAEEIADARATFLIACIGEQAVGYAKLLAGAPDAAISGDAPIELVRLYVRAGQIGTGVGARLMQACIGQARQFGFRTLWLGVWERNLRAQMFYGRWGFEQVGTHVFQLGTDAQTDLLLQKTLAAQPD